MLAEGTLCDELPAIEVSIRTTERLVAEIRSALKLKRNRSYLRLEKPSSTSARSVSSSMGKQLASSLLS